MSDRVTSQFDAAVRPSESLLLMKSHSRISGQAEQIQQNISIFSSILHVLRAFLRKIVQLFHETNVLNFIVLYCEIPLLYVARIWRDNSVWWAHFPNMSTYNQALGYEFVHF